MIHFLRETFEGYREMRENGQRVRAREAAQDIALGVAIAALGVANTIAIDFEPSALSPIADKLITGTIGEVVAAGGLVYLSNAIEELRAGAPTTGV